MDENQFGWKVSNVIRECNLDELIDIDLHANMVGDAMWGLVENSSDSSKFIRSLGILERFLGDAALSKVNSIAEGRGFSNMKLYSAHPVQALVRIQALKQEYNISL